jgi:hypothetical protein
MDYFQVKRQQIGKTGLAKREERLEVFDKKRFLDAQMHQSAYFPQISRFPQIIIFLCLSALSAGVLCFPQISQISTDNYFFCAYLRYQ